MTVTKLEDDPLIRGGVMAIPSDQLDNLERINEAGVEFSELLIAHELPPEAIPAGRNPGWCDLDGYDLAVLENKARVPQPIETVRETRKVGDRIEHLTRRAVDDVSQLTKTSETVGRSSWKVGLGAVTAVAATVAVLDPAIIGVTTMSGYPNEGELAAHYILARWDW